MKNLEIRKALAAAMMKQYELAELMGIAEFTLSRRMRNELPKEEQDRILELIQKNKKDGE